MSIRAIVTEFWDWVDKRYIMRRILTGVVLWLTVASALWAMDFATTCQTRSGLDIAAIIGALLTPLSVLQGFVFKFYLDSKGQ